MPADEYFLQESLTSLWDIFLIIIITFLSERVDQLKS